MPSTKLFTLSSCGEEKHPGLGMLKTRQPNMSKNAAPRSELQLQTSSWFPGMDPLSDLLYSRGKPLEDPCFHPTHSNSATQDTEFLFEPDSGPVMVLWSLCPPHLPLGANCSAGEPLLVPAGMRFCAHALGPCPAGAQSETRFPHAAWHISLSLLTCFRQTPPSLLSIISSQAAQAGTCELGERGAHSLPLPVLSRLCVAPVSAEKTILKRKQAAVTPGVAS